MAFWGQYSCLTIVGSEVFANPLFAQLMKDVGESLSITYIPNVEKLRDRLDHSTKSYHDLPEAVILPDFTSANEVRSLQSPKVCLYGLPSLFAMRFNGRNWIRQRAVYSFAMADAVVAITGFRDSEIVNQVAVQINWMGGSVRRKLDPTVTHLVAYRCAGEKVRKAALTPTNVSTMKLSWVEEAWNSRHLNPNLNACDSDFVARHRARVFQACCLYFIGFSDQQETLAELESAVKDHDGTLATDLADEKLTHVVVADDWHKSGQDIDLNALVVSHDLGEAAKSPRPHSFSLDPELQEHLHEIAVRVPVLKLDWFWKSLQSTYICPPQDYYYIPEPEPGDSPCASFFSQRPSLEICSPTSYRLSLDALDKENTQPILECSERDHSHKTCPSPESEVDLSVRLRHDRSEQQLSREEVIAQLADPLLIPSSASSNRRCSQSRTSFTFLDKPSPLSASAQNCSTPASEGNRRPLSTDCLEEKSTRSPVHHRTPLEVFKSSLENSPKRFRSSPAKCERKTPQKSRLKDREHRVFEFFLTEQNYSSILEFLTQSVLPDILRENQEGGPLLPRQEADMVFGKLNHIYQLHKRLQTHLADLKSSWNMETSRLGEILLPFIDELEKVYSHYMQFYDEPHIKQLGRDYPRFLAFMRQVELRKEYGRQSLCDLLVRPVQRLPSLLLLMQGIQKFTPPTHPDHEDIVAFTTKLNVILEKINTRLKKTEEYMSLLNLFHDINGAPPEIVSASRNLICSLNVFQLDTHANGTPYCEPAIIFLLTDCLEIVRPKKRNTGDNHAIQAALAAVEGGSHGSLAIGDESGTEGVAADKRGTSISRNNSGASAGSSTFGGKRRYRYVHGYFIKLQDITRVLDLSTLSPERAAFSLIIRDASADTEKMEQVLTFCLAASFTASTAIATGKCPEAVETAVAAAAATLATRTPSTVKFGTSASAVDEETSTLTISTLADAEMDDLIIPESKKDNSTVAKLRYCVHEAKMSFLQRLCRNIMQVSFVANSPDELLVEMQPETVLAFDLDSVFSHAGSISFKTKKFSRHLGRTISLKTPHRPTHKIHTTTAPSTVANPRITPHAGETGEKRTFHLKSSALGLSVPVEPPSPTLSFRSESIEMPQPSRPSVLGSILGGFLSHGSKTPQAKQSMRDLPSAELDTDVAKRGARTSSLWLEFDSDAEDGDNSGATENRDLAECGDSNIDDDDLISVNSYTSAAGPWPAFLPPTSQSPVTLSKKSKNLLNLATASSTSLRSNSSRHVNTGKSRQSFGGLMSATRKSICRSFLGTRKPKQIEPPTSKRLPYSEPAPLQLPPPQPSAAPQEKPLTQQQLQDSEVVSGSTSSLTAPLARPEDISSDSIEGSREAKEKAQMQIKDEDVDIFPHSSIQMANPCTIAGGLTSPVAGVLDKSVTMSTKQSRPNTLRRMLASPFRPARKSAVTGDCRISSPEGVTSWSSLVTLTEEIDVDEEVEAEQGRLVEIIMTRSQGQRVAGEDTCSMILPQAPPLFSAFKKLRSKKKGKSLSRRAYGSEIFNRGRLDESEAHSKNAESCILPTVPETTEATATPDLSRLEEGEEHELSESVSSSSTRKESSSKRSFIFK